MSGARTGLPTETIAVPSKRTAPAECKHDWHGYVTCRRCSRTRSTVPASDIAAELRRMATRMRRAARAYHDGSESRGTFGLVANMLLRRAERLERAR